MATKSDFLAKWNGDKKSEAIFARVERMRFYEFRARHKNPWGWPIPSRVTSYLPNKAIRDIVTAVILIIKLTKNLFLTTLLSSSFLPNSIKEISLSIL